MGELIDMVPFIYQRRIEVWEDELLHAEHALEVAQRMLRGAYLEASGQLQLELYPEQNKNGNSTTHDPTADRGTT